MTLPGINRNTAQNIIEYRCRIGGFKKVEDLALVSGVGAAKLGVMRPEICVSQKRSSSSRGSSPGSSRQDVNLNERSMRRSNSNAQLRINVNSANVFQLMKVKGVGQLIAENIVAHRDKKGPFKSLDELSKVKGIGAGLLGAIRHHLTLSDIDVSSATISTIANHSLSSTPKQLQNANGHLPNVGQTEKEDNVELSAKLNNSFEDLLELLGPLARKSIRPKVQPFNFKRNNTPAIRIATWNLDGCSADKIFNPGVRDVICMTVLENGLGLIAVQEIADIEALEKVRKTCPPSFFHYLQV
ncbi:Endonuclease/exonuclease/phosphatase family domain-containing protein 1 [Acanthosepion pharaonis]|uniref:Endonuclease/exonuclease/phosphatase family domain-containing protein 1 n=1 Tax=Acanthosepion pharaonis TaxID=158019 RepID=A0A812BPH8_ACAPH|nr:Endonuclease/exonuclease/phosphatase family domain-containing protein 1 [Sepia pharaonis]